MNNPISNKLSIFLSVDQQVIKAYFNPHDPAPIYKRQLSQEFEQYIMTAILSARRHSIFTFKIFCREQDDQQFIEPLIYAMRGHFSEKKLLRVAAFDKFKRRTYTLLFVSLAIVMICHGVVPILLKKENTLNSGLSNSMDIFSWVILWQPIDKLIFHWNPFLKDISIMDRLTKADVTIVQNES
jgi:hypothetical protein